MKLGLFGGSFDPVHLGHLLVAQAAVEELGLDRLFFLPAAQSPFKPENQPAPAPARLQLLRLALAGRTNCEIDDQEIRRGGVSYTIETLRDYAKRFPHDELFYLIGADNAAKLNEWREADKLAKLAEFVAIPRPVWSSGFSRPEPPEGGTPNFPPPFRGRTLKGFPLAVSSSEIRARVKAGLPVEPLVPPPVAEAIRAAKLYL
jgi:nicotinate-nucleotide adenylyltransferase